MTIQTNFPNIKPTLLLDFANVKALDPRITFTRASEGRYYDGKTFAKAEENLILQSQAFNNASWLNIGTTETDNAATAPDGTTTAATLNDGTDASGHDIGSQGSTITAGVTYTASAFFKDVDRQFVILACSTGPNTWASAKFNLTAGTAGSTSTTGAGWSVTSSSITPVGNSWFRCTLTFVSGSSATAAVRLGMATDSTTFTAGQRGLESYTGSNKTIQIWGAQLEQRSSVTAYTATTTQPITNYIPQLMTAASGVGRLDHDPVTGASNGFLVEEQRTNLLTYSEQFDNAAWIKIASSVTANTLVAPDGTLTADLVTEDTASSAHYITGATSSVTSGMSYTGSIYAKNNGRVLQIAFNVAAFGSNAFANFDLSAGSVGTVGSSATATIQNVGNGWYRCTLTATATATTSGTWSPYLATSGSSSRGQNYTGDGYSGIYIWGAQLEAGSFPTSYIPTVAAQVTRSADSASMTGTNFTSWYRQDEGTLYAEANSIGNDTADGIAALSDGTQNNRIILRRRGDTSVGGLIVVVGGTTFASISSASGSYVTGVFGKNAIGYAVDNFAYALNSAVAGTDISGIVPTVVNQFRIGADGDGALPLNGHIRKIAFYPARLTNAQLQALTS